MSNHFGVTSPQSMVCHVMEYHWGRKLLLVRLKRENSPEVQYIKFMGLEYFAGPMEWRGADFVLRSQEECLTVLKDADRVNEFVTAENLHAKLFTVDLPNSMVVIVSKSALKSGG